MTIPSPMRNAEADVRTDWALADTQGFWSLLPADSCTGPVSIGGAKNRPPRSPIKPALVIAAAQR